MINDTKTATITERVPHIKVLTTNRGYVRVDDLNYDDDILEF